MKPLQLLFILTLSLVSFTCLSGEPIIIGETIRIDSKVLMKKASFNIRLPSSYQALKHKRYPVFYNLGSDTDFAVTAGTIELLSHNQGYPMPEAILVSLTTETAVSIINRGVKSEDFINFLETDVIPYIDENYRSQPFRILASGERFGMAPLYALIHNTHLFQAYITQSPWITDKSGLLSEFESFLKNNNNISAFLSLSSQGGSRVAKNYDKLVTILHKYAPETLVWKSSTFDKNTNISKGLPSLSYALKSLFSDMYLTSDSSIVTAGVKSIKRYYQQLSKNKYGYTISYENALRDLGYGLLREGNVKNALEVFNINLKSYPDSPHVYAAMAWALAKDNELTDALSMRKTAYKLAVEQNSEYESYYKQLLTDLENKISSN
jgi:predicted alpha/beta superfamily hydrolase